MYLRVMRNLNIFLILSVFALLSGCVSVDERVAERSADVDQAWEEAMAEDREVVMGWRDAVDYMLEHNPEIVDARKDIEFAAERKRVAWKRLLPRPSATLSYNKLLSELSETRFDDITSVVNLFISFPNPFNFAETLYRTEYLHRQAVFNLEMQRRTKIAQLLTLYWTERVIEFRERELEALGVLASADPDYRPEFEEMRFSLKRERSDFFASMRDLMGGGARTFSFLKSDVPEFDYSEYDVSNPEMGRLYRRMAGLQLVASDLSVMGLKINQLPRFNVFTVVPPIFSDRGGRSSEFDFDRIRLSSSMFYSFDTSGSTKLSIERAEFLREMQEKRLSSEMLSMVEDFRSRQDDVRKANEKLGELAVVEANLKSLNDPESQRMMFRIQKLQAEARLNLVNLQSKVWVMDESQWRDSLVAELAESGKMAL